jgi:hypothetical protein
MEKKNGKVEDVNLLLFFVRIAIILLVLFWQISEAKQWYVRTHRLAS